MNIKENMKKGIFYSFIPRKLEVPDHPHWRIFPFNVLFARYTEHDDKLVMGTAVYEPDLMSYKAKETIVTMEYNNVYGGNSWLTITYDADLRQYTGEKFVDEKSVGLAIGMNWKMFFAHLTALGLSDGECCEFEATEGD